MNVKKVNKTQEYQEWQLTGQEYRQTIETFFLAKTATIIEATIIPLVWAGGRNFTQPAGLGY